jgi:predicted metal-binding protein
MIKNNKKMEIKVDVKSGVEKTEIPFKKIVMICSHCGDQFNSNQSMGTVERIKNELKSCVKEKMAQGEVRVITTSCLSMCPANKIAIAVAGLGQTTPFVGLAVDPYIAKEELFDQLFVSSL